MKHTKSNNNIKNSKKEKKKNENKGLQAIKNKSTIYINNK